MSSKDEPHILGIDEAGRGPVLGPMVYAAAWYPIKDKAKLASMSFRDSKELKPEEIENLFETIITNDSFGWAVDSIHPEKLSAKMLRVNKYNLNYIAHDAAVGLIRTAIDQGYNISEAYLDTVGPPETYKQHVERMFPHIKVTVESKADSTYPIVSAASILAKETRDKEVEHWEFREEKAGMMIDKNTGSGYPGDPATKLWLKNHFDEIFGFPSICRFCWDTVGRIIKSEGIQVDWEKKTQRKISFSNTSTTKNKCADYLPLDKRKESYYKKRRLTIPINFKYPFAAKEQKT